MLESKLLFSQPASYKDELGKILYVFMTFLNTNGSIVSFGKKKDQDICRQLIPTLSFYKDRPYYIECKK